MKPHFDCRVLRLNSADQSISYRVYRNRYQPNGRRLLMLHGAGVAGEFTWGPMVEHLSHWGEILVPDLRGMGDTRYGDQLERAFTVEEVLGDVIGLLDHLGWWAVDLAGYSFGGLVGMLLKAEHPARVHKMFLLEPALLDRPTMEEVNELRAYYSSAALLLREAETEAIERGVVQFLDAISPNRIPSPKSEAMIIERLSYRAGGFANALDAVTDAGRRLDREQLLRAQAQVSCLIGGRSVEAMHRFQQSLAHRLEDWRYHSIRGCDHSLPFQKPRQIARLFNEEMAHYLESRAHSGHPAG